MLGLASLLPATHRSASSREAHPRRPPTGRGSPGAGTRQAVRAALDRALSGLSRRSGDSGDSHVAWTPDTPRSRRWQATVLCRALRSGLPPGAKAPARPAALALEGPGSSGSSSPSGGLPTPLAAPGARGAPSPPPRPVAETTPVASELEDAAACGPPPRMRRDERRRSSLLSVPEVPTARAPRSRGPSSAHRQPHGVASRLQDDAEGERAARSACERRGLRAPSWQDVGALPGAVDDGAECAGGGRTPARWCGALGRPESQRPPVPPAAAVQPRLGRKYSITVADSSAGGALPLELGRSREVETPPSEGSSRSGSDPPSRGAEVGAAALRRPHPLDSPPARPPLGSRCADGSPRDFVRKLQQKLEREALLRGRASGDACEPPHADGGTRVATACAEGDAAGSDSESHAVDLLLGVLAPDCVDVPLPSPVMMSPRNSSSAQTSRVASRNRSRDTSQNITPGRSPRDAQAHGPEPTGRDSLTFSSMTFSHSSASPPAASSRPSFASSRPSFAASLIGSSRPSLCMATMAACGSSRPSLGAAGCISSRPSLNAGGVSTRPSLNAGASSRPSLNASGSCSSRPSLSAALSQIGSARPSFNATGSGSSRPSLAAALSAASSPRPSLLGAQGEMLCLEEDFKAGETLGAGSYGRVFAAQHRRTGQVVAVKEVFFQPPQAAEAPPSELRALERELALCERLRHHRIVRFLGHEIGPAPGDHVERLLIFLEFCPGGSVASHLRTYGPLAAPVVARYAHQLLEGLCYLHSRSPPVAHRDLKCANLLLTHDANVKIADFGCSKWLTEGSGAPERGKDTVVGSVFWTAPEVLEGDQETTTAVDVWSFGGCLLEMATAKRPWAERRLDNIFQACKLILSPEQLPAIPDCVDATIRATIAACFQRAPHDRPRAEELMSLPLFDAAAREADPQEGDESDAD